MNNLFLYKKNCFVQYISIILIVIGTLAVSCKKKVSTQQFTITFNANEGEGSMATQSFTKGAAQTLNTNLFTRIGYSFATWNTKADGTGDTYTDGQSIIITTNITLYAQWGLPVTGISLNKNTTTLGIGSTETLTATIAPTNASNKTINWSSTDNNIVAVDNNGVILAKNKGNATITATTADGNYQASCIVTVKAFPDANFRAVLVDTYDCIEEDGDINPLNPTNQAAFAVTDNLVVNARNISSLQGIEYFTALTSLDCYSNALTSLDLSKNTALSYLICNDNKLSSLNLSKNIALTSLFCSSNQLSSLDISQNTALTQIQCNNNMLNSLDISKNTALTQLLCHNNSLNSLDVSKNTALTRLECNNNAFNSLNIAMLSSLDMSMGYFGNQKNGINLTLTLTTAQNNAWTIKNNPENKNITYNILP